MTSPASPPSDFEMFARAVAEIAERNPAEISRDSLLIDDIGLDSLGLVELIALLYESYRAEALIDQLESRDWSQVTAGQLFDECHRPRTAGPR